VYAIGTAVFYASFMMCMVRRLVGGGFGAQEGAWLGGREVWQA
jgi:hypothetical protein